MITCREQACSLYKAPAPLILLTLLASVISSCASYEGGEPWRRSTCVGLANAEERAQCEVEAGRSKNEYEQDVEEALEN